MAVVAGCNLCLKPAFSVQLAEMNLLSPDGECRCFQDDGNNLIFIILQTDELCIYLKCLLLKSFWYANHLTKIAVIAKNSSTLDPLGNSRNKIESIHVPGILWLQFFISIFLKGHASFLTTLGLSPISVRNNSHFNLLLWNQWAKLNYWNGPWMVSFQSWIRGQDWSTNTAAVTKNRKKLGMKTAEPIDAKL